MMLSLRLMKIRIEFSLRMLKFSIRKKLPFQVTNDLYLDDRFGFLTPWSAFKFARESAYDDKVESLAEGNEPIGSFTVWFFGKQIGLFHASEA